MTQPASKRLLTEATAAATYSSLALLPLQASLPTATVTVTANANVDNLWPGWYNTGQSVYTDLSAMTDPTVFGPYFYGGQPYRDTWWGGGPAIYNQLNSGTNSAWAVAVRIAGSTRLLVGMNGVNGNLTASQFVIEIDGRKISRRYIDTGIVYDGHQTGLLLTFPDTRGHDIRIWSKAGLRVVGVDPGGTVAPIPAPFGGKKRLVIAGDSWTEGTSQAGPAVSYAAMLQLAADWDVAYLGNGGTGYVATGPSYASTFGSSQRLAAMESFAPDLWVFFGSINDDESTATAVQTAAAAAYSALATALPNAKGIVVGPQLPGHPLVSAALAAAAGAAPNVLAYIDPAAQNWTTPAGVTGPTDGSHPSAIGTEHLAAHLIAAIRAVTAAHGDTSW